MPGRRVLLEVQDRPPPVGHEVLAGQWEQPVHVRPDVLGARVLRDVVRTEGEQVTDLTALGVDHAEPLAAAQPGAAPLPRRHLDQAPFAHRTAALGVTAVLVHERDRHAALADGGRDALDRAEADVPAGEDAGHAGLEQVRVALLLPAPPRRTSGPVST